MLEQGNGAILFAHQDSKNLLTILIVCLTQMQLPRPICMCCVSIGVLGLGKLNYGLGSNVSEEILNSREIGLTEERP